MQHADNKNIYWCPLLIVDTMINFRCQMAILASQ